MEPISEEIKWDDTPKNILNDKLGIFPKTDSYKTKEFKVTDLEKQEEKSKPKIIIPNSLESLREEYDFTNTLLTNDILSIRKRLTAIEDEKNINIASFYAQMSGMLDDMSGIIKYTTVVTMINALSHVTIVAAGTTYIYKSLC